MIPNAKRDTDLSFTKTKYEFNSGLADGPDGTHTGNWTVKRSRLEMRERESFPKDPPITAGAALRPVFCLFIVKAGVAYTDRRYISEEFSAAVKAKHESRLPTGKKKNEKMVRFRDELSIKIHHYRFTRAIIIFCFPNQLTEVSFPKFLRPCQPIKSRQKYGYLCPSNFP